MIPILKCNRRVLTIVLSFLFIFNFLFLLINIDNISLASDKVETPTDDEIRLRRIPEDNGIADLLCKMVDLMHSDIARAMLAFSLFAAGVGAFFGKLTIGWFASFAVGAAVYFGSFSMLSFFAPYSNIAMGCKCKQYLIIGAKQDRTGFIKIPTKLTDKCKRLDSPLKTN